MMGAIIAGLGTFLGTLVALIGRLIALKFIGILIVGIIALIIVISGTGHDLTAWGVDYIVGLISSIIGERPDFSLSDLMANVPDTWKWGVNELRLDESLSAITSTILYIVSATIFLGLFKLATTIASPIKLISVIKSLV